MKVELILTEMKGCGSHICDRCGERNVNTTLYEVKYNGWKYKIYSIEICENCYKELKEEK